MGDVFLKNQIVHLRSLKIYEALFFTVLQMDLPGQQDLGLLLDVFETVLRLDLSDQEEPLLLMDRAWAASRRIYTTEACYAPDLYGKQEP
jgi:hypothetical protein